MAQMWRDLGIILLAAAAGFPCIGAQTVCGPGQVVVGAACIACPSGSFISEESHSRTACEPWTRCELHHFISVLGTSTSNAVCRLCGQNGGPVCPTGMWQSAQCTATVDRQCSPCTACQNASLLNECNHTHDAVCDVPIFSLGVGAGASGASDDEIAMTEAIILTCCIAVMIAAVGTALYAHSYQTKSWTGGIREFWWSLEDDVEFNCGNKATLSETAMARLARQKTERMEANWIADMVMEEVIESAVAYSERQRQERSEQQTKVQVQTLVHQRAASESLLKATHEHYEESRLAIREGREERERELEELTATLELVAARGFPEDELATAEMELRQAGIDRNEAQRRRDTEAARADQVRSERDDLERQVQDIETEIETLEAQDDISTDDLRTEQARLKEKIHATRQEVDAEWERELGELDAQAKATNAAQCETNDRARTERMAEEESDNADRVRNMIAEHDEIMAKMHSDFEQQFEDIARAKDKDIARAKDPPSAPV